MHSHSHAGAVAHSHSHALGLAHSGAHDHAQAHTPAVSARRVPKAQTARAELAEGAGEGKILFLDAPSGIAGDMTIASLLDLGVPFPVVETAVAALALPGVSPVVEAVYAGAIGAARFDVRVQGKQPERTYRHIDELLSRAKLAAVVKDLARRIFRRLGEAESEVHRISLEEVHFHEVGSADAIVDIVGAAACIAYLGATVVASPLPLGRGFVTSRHGVLPLPAPATVACLRGVPTYDAGIEAELVTPTGAAIVATVATRFERWPSMAPIAVGWGAGTRTLADRPNVLRAVLGDPTSAEVESPRGSHVVLEANLDDSTGELVGHVIARLLDAGALDAWAVPVTMKKGRPGVVLSVLARTADRERIAALVLEETPSIGVRFAPVDRLERPRTIRVVSTRFGDIPVKVSAGPHGAPVLKPEFDVCAEAARRAEVPVRVVLAAALRAAGDA